LDSIYHFEDKLKFFQDCMSLLPASGSVGVTDLILTQSSSQLPWWVSLVMRAMHVNVKYLWTEQEYYTHLKAQGWVNIQVKPFNATSVLAGWFPIALRQHLEYAVIVAERPKPDVPKRAKPKVAIVGSGLSGLMTAHSLAGTHDVTIFEANSRGGLSGQGELVHGQVVDIPLRYFITFNAILIFGDVSCQLTVFLYVGLLARATTKRWRKWRGGYMCVWSPSEMTTSRRHTTRRPVELFPTPTHL
jgi:hypothetical protein